MGTQGRLEGKVAVITGGASGIGEGSVRRFVEEGARVIIADLQDAPGQALAKELGPNRVSFILMLQLRTTWPLQFNWRSANSVA